VLPPTADAPERTAATMFVHHEQLRGSTEHFTSNEGRRLRFANPVLFAPVDTWYSEVA
jgi:hypothetical protein